MEVEISRFSDLSPKMIFKKRLRKKLFLDAHDEKFIDMISKVPLRIVEKYFVPRKIELLTMSPLTHNLELFMIFTKCQIRSEEFRNDVEKKKLMYDRYVL